MIPHEFYVYLSWFCITLPLAAFYLIFREDIKELSLQLKTQKQLKARQLQDTAVFKRQALFLSLLIVIALKLALDINLILAAVIFVVLIFVLPPILVKRARDKLHDEFDKALVDALLSLSSSLKAGLTIQGAFEVAMKSTAPIFAEQAERVVTDSRLGVHIVEWLGRVRSRLPTDNCNMAFGALIIGRQIGGPIPLILARIASTIRERERVEGRLRTLTAQGKGQAKLIFSLPIIIGLGTAIFTPSRWEVMQGTLVGQVFLIVCTILWVIGLFVTMQML
jgi:tight adherence protein B